MTIKHSELNSIAIAIFLLLGTSCGATFAQSADTPLVIHVQNGAMAKEIARLNNATVVDHVPGTSLYSLQANDGDSAALKIKLQSDSDVLYTEADSELGTPETYGGDPVHLPFDHHATTANYMAQFAYSQVDIPINPQGQINLPNLGSKAGRGVTVAVLDTGVFSKHLLLRSHMLSGFNALHPGTQPDDIADGNTNVAVGHGTFIAGMIARLAPGARILPIRVLNGDGIGTRFSVVKGIYYAVAHGAKVINLSLSCAEYSEVLSEAIDDAEAKGVLVIAAAGNGSSNVPQYPAALDNVIAVAAVDSSNQKATYSNYGKHIAVVAPGTAVAGIYGSSGFARWSGTSFAAPFVSIEAAVIWSANPSFKADQVGERIKASAHSVNELNKLYRGQLGAGLIDVSNALTMTD